MLESECPTTTVVCKHLISRRNLDPLLAKKLALGDVCPITLLPMVDVNPGYMPRALKSLPVVMNTAERKQSGAEADKAKNKSILSFFGACAILNSEIPPK
jgi:hypothetical protein